jgi:hypothetical protein
MRKNRMAGSGLNLQSRPGRSNKAASQAHSTAFNSTPRAVRRARRRGPWPDRPLRAFAGWLAGLTTFLEMGSGR